MIIDESFNPGKRINFLEALIKVTQHQVLLMLDKFRLRDNEPVKAWAFENVRHIECFICPA